MDLVEDASGMLTGGSGSGPAETVCAGVALVVNEAELLGAPEGEPLLDGGIVIEGLDVGSTTEGNKEGDDGEIEGEDGETEGLDGEIDGLEGEIDGLDGDTDGEELGETGGSKLRAIFNALTQPWLLINVDLMPFPLWTCELLL